MSDNGNGSEHWHAIWSTLVPDGRCVINGESTDSLSGKTYPNVTPINGARLCEVAECQPEDIDLAVSSARRCWEDGSWARETPKNRGAVLRRLSQLIIDNIEELALLETLDTGRPIRDSLTVDIPLSSQCFEWYADIINKRYDEAFYTSSQNLITIMREPVGVVGAIVPWNYPLLMASWKLAPALAMGNSVVLKPAEQSPLTAIRIAQLALDAGLPPGALNVCPGYGIPAGRALGLHQDVECVSFTGSIEVGKQLQQYAGLSNMKRIWVETGGKGPQIVFDDVTDLDKVATGIAWGAYYNQGQSCSAGTRLIVQATIHDALTERVAAVAQSLKLGDPLDPNTDLGAIISEQQLTRIHGYCENALADGATVLVGGGSAQVIDNGFYYQPTVIDRVRTDTSLFQEEVFGPVLSVTPFNTRTEAIAIANKTVYGLAGGIWSNDINAALSVARSVRLGTVWINTYDSSDFGVPFGGFGQSGYGRAKSLHALEKYSDLKSLWVEFE